MVSIILESKVMTDFIGQDLATVVTNTLEQFLNLAHEA
jgi:hypothetical protein